MKAENATTAEHYPHDACAKCGCASEPAEGVPDQALRICPDCGDIWVEDFSRPPRRPRHAD